MPPKRKSRPDPASIDLVASKKQKKPSKTIITSIQIEDDGETRCFGNDSKIYREYHDTEWGVPILNDDNKLFELLCLEGQQAGLSWITVLKKRDEYRKEFHNFDIEKVSKITPAEIAKKLTCPQLIRHKGKLESIVGNALACIQIQKEFGSLHRYLWDRMEGGMVLQNNFTSFSQVPAKTGLAEDLSEDLKKRGFKFFGPPSHIHFYKQLVLSMIILSSN